jgi:hypothetical protein
MRRYRSGIGCCKSLSEVAVKVRAQFNIYLSSRRYSQISMKNADELVMGAQEDHCRDIGRCFRANLRVRDRGMEDELLRKSNQVFLWVKIAFKLLNDAYQNRRVWVMKKMLHDLPIDLENFVSGTPHQRTESP